jgi:hypothetical protein
VVPEPLAFAQPPPDASQRSHWYAYVTLGPLQLPALADNVCPLIALPLTEGADTLTGADCPGAMEVESADAVPPKARRATTSATRIERGICIPRLVSTGSLLSGSLVWGVTDRCFRRCFRRDAVDSTAETLAKLFRSLYIGRGRDPLIHFTELRQLHTKRTNGRNRPSGQGAGIMRSRCCYYERR